MDKITKRVLKIIQLCIIFLAFQFGAAQSFTNPVGNLSDPHISYIEGFYYYTGTIGNRVAIKRATTLEGLKHKALNTIFDSGDPGAQAGNYWNQEVHKIDGKWYVYYTASSIGTDSATQRNYVIECSDANPITGSWTFKGQLFDPSSNHFASTPTVAEINGSHYFLWSGVESSGTSPLNIYISAMTNPWTLSGSRSKIYTSGDLSGTTNGEAPSILVKDSKVFLTYTANGCGSSDGKTGLMYMADDTTNPLLLASWTKVSTAVFDDNAANNSYNPNHQTFFKSPDNLEYWFSFTSRFDDGAFCDNQRSTRAQKLTFDGSGIPQFGVIAPIGSPTEAPSGETSLAEGTVVQNGLYRIRSKAASGTETLEIAGIGIWGGANVSQWVDNTDEIHHKWYLQGTDIAGEYIIISAFNGLAIEVGGCSVSAPSNINMWYPSGASCQVWTIIDLGSGDYRLTNKNSGKVMELDTGNNNIRQNNLNVAADFQKFKLEYIDETFDAFTSVADGNWSETTTWNKGVVPSSTEDVIIKNNVTLDQDDTVSSISIFNSGSLSLNSSRGLLVSGNLTNNGSLNAEAASSLIVAGTSNGNLTYKVGVADTNWHLISAPVLGETYGDTWNLANQVDQTGQTNTLAAVSTYSNTTDSNGDWNYFTIGNSDETFSTSQGYSLKRTVSGDYSFTGTLQTTDVSSTITANDLGGANENRWTLMGNPFASYISVDDLLGLATNSTALENNREALYIWNGSSYLPLTTGYIHPGQGFFVNSDVASTSITINKDMLSHQTGVTFYKTANKNTSIKLYMSDVNNIKSTEISYLANKTIGLDPKFDIGTFTGVSSEFSIYSRLLSDDKGVNFMKQALPNSNYEDMVIPIGIKANKNTEITFFIEAVNLPSNIKVFLEDRVNNIFKRLDETNSRYKVTLNKVDNGVGRFYLHTTQSVLNINDEALANINLFKIDDSTIRLTGLSQEKMSFSLYNILGKELMTNAFSFTGVKDISLPKVAKGIYIIQLETKVGKINKKIFLE